MVHVKLFGKLFEVDLAAPERQALWWFDRSWVKHALTNEQVLFNRETEPCAEALVDAVEAFAPR